ncbi:hypothetical protein [Streptomyces sp. SPB4]|uniref:hypothetical protein n=1 Tax=Streptomyces TaxID=1883 RepID=UPI0024762492|nr:hypothetical protein [Streptomyces sp. SPB4]MDH6542357.1 hypothetical protein [Streptomyces sp. SPB4]
MEHEQTVPEPRKAVENGAESDTPEFPPVNAANAGTRRRGRTTLLIAAALALGALAGTATGYAIQYHRAPTALPPLAQQKLALPKALAPDDATTLKTINANRWHKTDDDLVKLLVEPPSGAKGDGSGYDTLDSHATGFERSEPMFRELVDSGFRRIATTTWEQGDIGVDVQLIQFKDYAGAEKYREGQSGYVAEERFAGNGGASIPGIPAELGHLWVFSKTDEKPGFYPVRQARAVARRGDIVMLVFYFDKRGRGIEESDVAEVAKRQWERL